MTTLTELEAAGAKARAINAALETLKAAEHKLALVNRYAGQHAGKHWSPDLTLEKSNDHWSRNVTITVNVPYEFIVRQAIDEVHAARRAVVAAGGELPTATEQVQRRQWT
jgi:hypothetical protein